MKKVLINCENREIRVAILEDDQLTELYIESLDNKTILNNVYKGRVEGVIPGLKAAFVNIGLERNAFLHFDDIRPEILREAYLRHHPEAAQTQPQQIGEGVETPLPMAAAPVAQPAPAGEPAPETPGDEYQPSEEELEAVAELSTARTGLESEFAPHPEPAQIPGAPMRPRDDFDGGRRRRRGRRGGRHQRDETGGGQESFARPDAPPPADRPYQEDRPQGDRGGQSGQYGEQGGGRRNRKRRRGRDRDRGERGNQQPNPPAGQAWVPNEPPVRGAVGTRGATNPYDVFSPYSQQPLNRRDRKQRRAKGWKPPVAPGSEPRPVDDGRESQEDFFGPIRRHQGPAPQQEHREEEDDSQARFFGAARRGGEPRDNRPIEDYDDDGPAPGNEKFPTQRPTNQGGQRKNRGKGRGRRTIRRSGPSYFAARKRKEDEIVAEESVKPKRTRKAAAKPEVAEEPKKARGRATAPKKATANPLAEALGVPAKKAVSRKKAAPVAEPVVETKPRASRKKAAAEEVVAAPEPTKRRTRKAAVEPVTPVAAEPAIAPAEEVKPKRGRRKAAVEPVAEKAAETPVASPVQSELPLVVDQPPQAPGPEAAQSSRRPRRGGRGRGRGRRDDYQPVQADRAPEAAPTDSAPSQAPQQVAPPAQDVVAGALPALPASDQQPQQQGERPMGRRERWQQERERRRQERPPRRVNAPVADCLKKGDELMVQVIKEEIGLKGARISTHLSLPGRYLVFLPFSGDSSGGVSRKVEDMRERQRLKHVLREINSQIGTDNAGFIIRTAGIDRSEEEILGDAEFLTNEWRGVDQRYGPAKATECVYNDSDILKRLARDIFDDSITEIIIDSPTEAEKLRETLRTLIPSLVERVSVYTDSENVFSRHGVEKQIQKAARRKVWLKSGGYLIIDEAEALTAIDVNTGKFVGKDDQEKMILKTNMEAARAIARELRLRDIGGLIVIDFIDMRDYKNRETLLNEFKSFLKKDRSKTSVSSISEFGLVEMTRKRVRRSLRKTIFMDCPYCQGSGAILNEQQIWLHIKNDIVQALQTSTPAPSLNIVCNPRIRAFMDQNCRDMLKQLEERYSVELKIGMSDVFHVENYAIERIARNGADRPGM